jgi:hypothetical protein
MSDTTMLPREFSDLEPFAPSWCLATETERFNRRSASTMDDMQPFYDAAMARLDEARAYLDTKDIHELDEKDTNLIDLLFSLIQISFSVELWRQARIPDTGAADIICWLEAPL